MKKYNFTNETKKIGGDILHRIVAVRDFYNKRVGLIKKGTLGGFIKSEDNLSHEMGAWVMDNASVFDNACVDGHGIVAENALLYGDAYVHCAAIMRGNARVHEHSCISGNAVIDGNTWVYDYTNVFGNALITGNAKVAGRVDVSGNAVISEDAEVYATQIGILVNSEVTDKAQIKGHAVIRGCIHAYGNAVIDSSAYIEGCVYVCDSARIGAVTIDGRDPYLMVCGDTVLNFPNDFKVIVGNDIN